jgi:hypothetical protein
VVHQVLRTDCFMICCFQFHNMYIANFPVSVFPQRGVIYSDTAICSFKSRSAGL